MQYEGKGLILLWDCLAILNRSERGTIPRRRERNASVAAIPFLLFSEARSISFRIGAGFSLRPDFPRQGAFRSRSGDAPSVLKNKNGHMPLFGL